MKGVRWLILALCFLTFFISLANSSVNKRVLNKQEVKAALKGIPVPFVENRGQINKKVAYYAKTFGGTVFVTNDGRLVYSLPVDKGGVALYEIFIGAKVKKVKGEEKVFTKVSYFRGKDRSKWMTNLSTYRYVSLGKIWDGIKLKVRADGDNVEKLFYVEPGADVRQIKVKLLGAKKIEVAEDGRLRVVTDKGNVYFTKPVTYQEEGGKRKYVDVAYEVKGDKYSFKLGEYDHTKPVIIDPLLVSTYLGGSGWDEAYALAVDDGNVYVAGWTDSSNFPTTSGAYDVSYSGGELFGGDAFISKLSSDLSTLLASTYLGEEEVVVCYERRMCYEEKAFNCFFFDFLAHYLELFLFCQVYS